ncbi:nitric oxide synthase-interacting [Lipomyces arxii]|uniref:nitric oxide synthase-interacting n=1 Tax=Lipomyces arxii TaxID=56418 RepID=UPI0034CFAC13
MARHSKRNTALAFFTSYERSLLSQYGRQKQRLSNDSFRELDTCQLCLMKSRDPVACPTDGHIFCRECVVENLISQLTEIKRMNKEIEVKQQEEAEKEAEDEEKSRQSEIRRFEMLQSGIGGSAKRKLDEQDSNSRKRRSTETYEPKLSAFWIPSLTPSIEKQSSEAPKLNPVCPSSEPEHTHNLSLKSLLSVSFEEQGKARVCPSCIKPFGSAMDAYLTVPCGHVICKNCYDKVMKPQHSGEKLCCFVCSEDLTAPSNHKAKSKTKHRGVLFLAKEGTGYSGGGKAVVEKIGVAFQG